MNFALVTAHNAAYQPLADITWNQNKRLYAERWGYDAIAKTEDFKHPAIYISFERTELIIELLESGQYDWIHACGCDTMITNFNIPLSDIADNNYDFVIAVDCYNLNNDSFLVRNTPVSIAWLKHVVSLREQYVTAKWLDQSAMIDTIEMMGNRIKIVPQHVMNSYNYDEYNGMEPHIHKVDILGNRGQWESGDFLIHWPGVPQPRRLILAQEMLSQVIK
jgi:hypothetical protein